ncbi:MAG TPA: hypothetical protein VHM28_12505 [Anaerolineales bacterium]|jgi:hypothetical protein|nr:hypothetical protein [Anaerolineales bacterium]
MKIQRIILLFVLTLTGCGLLSSKPTIFDSSPCKAPCWQNVTPDITTEQDALAIFPMLADGNKVNVTHDSYSGGYDDEIVFVSASSRGLVSAYISDGRISMMEFFGNSGDDFTLKHAIELFGEPENVLVEILGDLSRVTLFNLNKGIAFGWIDKDIVSGNGEINPDQAIELVWFFNPNRSDLFLNNKYGGLGNEVIKHFHPWIGYGKISDKYWPPETLSP